MRSCLTELRALTPKRALSQSDAYQVAEQQAYRLLALSEVITGPVPEFIIADLPRFHVERKAGMSVSGVSDWRVNRWVILLNADEPLTRQRFSLAHEFKHILDHPYVDYLYPFSTSEDRHEATERIADHFAANLLMPRMWIKRAWYGGTQDAMQMANQFGVSQAAMKYRLSSMGIIERATRRCDFPFRQTKSVLSVISQRKKVNHE